MGKLDVVVDPENRKTKYTYYADGKANQVIRAFETALQQNYQTNEWTPNGLLEEIRNAKGYSTTYTYDGFDRGKRVTFADGSYTEALQYDANGNVLQSRTRAGQIFDLQYDVLDRLFRKATPDRVETFAYELTGLQTCAEVWGAGNGTTTCGSGLPTSRTSTAFDAAGRLKSETSRIAEVNYQVGYQYDAASNRTGVVWPDGWRAVYGFDPLNRLVSAAADADGNGSAETPLSLYAYDALSQLIGIRRGSANWTTPVTSSDLAWEPDGDLDALTHTFNGEVAGFSYDYDKSAKLISELKAAAFAYAPAVAKTISYDQGAVGSVQRQLDQYASVDGKPASYDANGNRTLLDGLTTTHDSENRLTAASKGSMDVAYLYDASGRRTMKNFSSGGTDVTFVSASDTEIAEYSSSGTLLRRYVPGLRTDDLIAMVEATGAISYYHPDRLGTVVAMTNGSGTVTDRYKYTPFGIEEPLALSGNPYRYNARRYDPETGLYHYRARYYDPSEAGGGRFLETDPVGYADQMNLYVYVANDPVNATDPTGEEILAEMKGYKLGGIDGLKPYWGHAYTQVTDTTTGESYTLRGGPSEPLEGGTGVLSNSPVENSQGTGPVTLTAQVDPASNSPDTKPGGYAEKAGGAETILSKNLGDVPLADVVKGLESVADAVNSEKAPYVVFTNSSNTVAVRGYEQVTGDKVNTGNDRYPGANPPPPCTEKCYQFGGY